MTRLLYGLCVLLALPVFVIIGSVIADRALQPTFERVDMAEPPAYLAVLGAWETPEGLQCRAFYRDRLLENAEAIPNLRFRVGAEDLATCQHMFGGFNTDRTWSAGFFWERPAWRAAVSAPDEPDLARLVVTYWPDDDYTAETRYRIDPVTAEPIDFEFRAAFGPAHGIGLLVFGGGGGTLAWVVFVVVLVIRALRSRHRAAPTEP